MDRHCCLFRTREKSHRWSTDLFDWLWGWLWLIIALLLLLCNGLFNLVHDCLFEWAWKGRRLWFKWYIFLHQYTRFWAWRWNRLWRGCRDGLDRNFHYMVSLVGHAVAINVVKQLLLRVRELWLIPVRFGSIRLWLLVRCLEGWLRSYTLLAAGGWTS